MSTPAPLKQVSLSSEEETAVRYASGFAISGVGNAVAAAAFAAAPFRPRLCGKVSSEPYNSEAVGKGSTTPVIE